MPSYRAVFTKYDITEQQWRILRVLWEQERCSASNLAEKTLIPGASLVGILDRLSKKELIKRIRSEQDRRRVFVEATRRGSALEEEITPQIDEIYAQLIGTTGERNWNSLVRTLKKFIKANEV